MLATIPCQPCKMCPQFLNRHPCVKNISALKRKMLSNQSDRVMQRIDVNHIDPSWYLKIWKIMNGRNFVELLELHKAKYLISCFLEASIFSIWCKKSVSDFANSTWWNYHTVVTAKVPPAPSNKLTVCYVPMSPMKNIWIVLSWVWVHY